MGSDSKYQDWIDWRRRSDSPGDFTETVMCGIRRYDQSRHRPFRGMATVVRGVSTRWPARLAVAAAVAVFGLIRLALSVYLSVE